jgi:hypothetical protein
MNTDNTQALMLFVEWCRANGATMVQVDGVRIEFGGRPIVAQPPAKKPIDDDEKLSDEERLKIERERRMFGSSL